MQSRPRHTPLVHTPVDANKPCSVRSSCKLLTQTFAEVPPATNRKSSTPAAWRGCSPYDFWLDGEDAAAAGARPPDATTSVHRGAAMISRRSFLTGLSGGAGLVVVGGALAACGKKDTGGSGSTGNGAKKTITLGFSQVGSESGWRSANTTSIKEAAAAAGINLKFSDAQQKQENQIAAIRDYIAQKVDIISFSPVVSSGWDTVLKEAQSAKIPVVLTDRQVDSDQSLWVSLVGSDFEAEGERAAHMLEKVLQASPVKPVNIAVL